MTLRGATGGRPRPGRRVRGSGSVRRRGRVDLPLDIEDNPLESMVEVGMLPVGRDDERETADPRRERSPGLND